MLKNIKAVLFDLDGTIIDSMWMWHQIDIEYLAKFNKKMPEDLQEAISGISVTETAIYMKNRFDIPDSIEKMINDWNEMAYLKYKNEVPLKEGIKEFLDYLKENNILCAIATSNSTYLAHVAVDAHGLANYFQEIITGEDIKNGKPQPDVYLECARRLKVEPQDCIVFEDISYGLLAGVRAGMKTCAIDDEYSKDEVAKKREIADYYIHNYFDIFNQTYEVLK